MFINVNYPLNVKSFMSIFDNFQLWFIPNIFEVAGVSQYNQENVPEKFKEMNTDAVFIKNAGQSLSIMLYLFTWHQILKIFASKKVIKHEKIHKFFNDWVQNNYTYTWYFDISWMVYLNIVGKF